MSFESAFESVGELVRNFESNEAYFTSPKYQEAEVRTDFLDKFWAALGWDVRHKLQTNPREQEVKVEKNPDGNSSSRRADYAFYLKPDFRAPVFFVEAKKPSRDLSNPEFYFQIVRYGRGASTPVGVLTDFEEFHVVDCRYEPDLKKSFPSAQIKKYHYKDYLDPDAFGDIYWLFSREAVEQGKLKEFSKTLPKQRGKGAAKLTADEAKPTDEKFLDTLEDYRLRLAKAFKKADESLTAEQLTEATMKVIDRLVFIRFLEDKNIESDYIVDQIAAKKGSSWKSFINWSKELDVKYNGVVFKPHEVDRPGFAPPDDKVFGAICDEISHRESKYLFSYIPIELLGSIYERFLGKVVTATAKRADIEYKPEVRKAGGVYYTPKYIVDYIVSNTVGKLIEGKTPKEVSALRFADIACGSGSFLIAVYDAVLHHVESYYNEHPAEAVKAKCVEIDKGIFALSLKQKQQILLDNVFGVDIDPQAVEVAQLSLFLKLLESESGASAGQLSFEKTKILPDLSKNILCGNSLVDYDIANLFALSPEDELRIKPFSFEQSFKGIMVKGGFDAIVGNPPYLGGREWKEENGRSYDYMISKYRVAEYQFDIYALFWERAISLTRKEGRVGYITPNTWLNNQSCYKLRSYILENTAVDQICDYSEVRVFAQVVVLPVVTILHMAQNTGAMVRIYRPVESAIVQTNSVPQVLWGRDELRIFNINIRQEDIEIRKKVESVGVALESLAEVKFGIKLYETGKGTPAQKASDAKNAVYEAASMLDQSYRRYLQGKDVFPYLIRWQSRWLKYGPNLAAPRDPKLFEGERLLIRRIVGERLIGTYTNEDFVTSQLLQIVKPFENQSSLYLLGILESTLLAYYFKKKYNRLDKTFPEIRIYELAALPIKEVDPNSLEESKSRDYLIAQVQQMLDTKKRLATSASDSERTQLQRKCDYLDAEIDKLVYQLYGLTEEEIMIVEGTHG